MIEAVNSVLSNASFARLNTDKVDANAINISDQVANSAPDEIADAGLVDSVKTTFDTRYSQAVTQILNPQSGQVLLQFPSEISLETSLAEQQTVPQNLQGAEASSQSSLSSEATAAQVNAQNGYTPPSTASISTFEVFENNQPREVSVNDRAQAALATEALNDAAQSGLLALSAIDVNA